jgi:hypothetical protein
MNSEPVFALPSNNTELWIIALQYTKQLLIIALFSPHDSITKAQIWYGIYCILHFPNKHEFTVRLALI